MDNQAGKLCIQDKGILGIEVSITFVSNLGTEHQIYISVTPSYINVAATGELNAQGLSALEDALTIAKIIQRRDAYVVNSKYEG